MGMKVYAVYSIPKSPEYHLEGLFETKDGAKEYIKSKKYDKYAMCQECFFSMEGTLEDHLKKCQCGCHSHFRSCPHNIIYDIQIEEVKG